MEILIRPAAIGDAGAMQVLNRDGLGYDYPIEKTKERLKTVLGNPEYKVFIAEADGRVIGYIHGADYHCTYTDPLKNILALVVEERYRGQGAGKALITAIEQWARECGAAGVRLVSGYNRTGAHRFYETCGYHMRKEQKNFIKLFNTTEAGEKA